MEKVGSLNLTWPMAKLPKLFGITHLVGKRSRSNFFFRVHWLSEEPFSGSNWVFFGHGCPPRMGDSHGDDSVSKIGGFQNHYIIVSYLILVGLVGDL